MRVRKKKNTEKRLMLCENVMLNGEREDIFNLSEMFENKQDVQLEIGCGKGGFITQMAGKFKTVNFIAIEKLREIIVVAAEKTVALELQNVKFLNVDALCLGELLPCNSISKIYLNFSDPWTKNRNVTRRLTNVSFLNIYKKLLSSGGEIVQKTDNRELFEFSLKMLEANDFKLIFVTYDLHKEPINDNVITEYEQKFINEGKPIHKLIAVKL